LTTRRLITMWFTTFIFITVLIDYRPNCPRSRLTTVPIGHRPDCPPSRLAVTPIIVSVHHVEDDHIEYDRCNIFAVFFCQIIYWYSLLRYAWYFFFLSALPYLTLCSYKLQILITYKKRFRQLGNNDIISRSASAVLEITWPTELNVKNVMHLTLCRRLKTRITEHCNHIRRNLSAFVITEHKLQLYYDFHWNFVDNLDQEPWTTLARN